MKLSFYSPKETDIVPLVNLFYQSFSKTYALSKTLIKDVFNLYIPAAGKNFIVAKDEKQEIVAFICGVKNMRQAYTQLIKTLPHSLKFLTPPHSRFITPPLFTQLFSGAHLLFGSTSIKHRKKGVFAKLMARALAQLKSEGVKKVWFETAADNHAVLALAKKFNFKKAAKFRHKNKEWLVYGCRL